MSGADIQAKVKRGLAKAVDKTGSGDLVYVKKVTVTGGGTSPIDPPTTATENVLLVDAIFKSIDLNQMDNTLVQRGDREMVSNADVELNVNDEITQGARKMYIVSVDRKEPAGVVLSYICVVRDK